MAIITPSAVISEIRGSVGTQTFSRNAYRAYVKLRKTPTMPASSYRSASKQALSDGNDEWNNLSDVDRAAWNANSYLYKSHARLGKEAQLSGYSAWVRAWINRQYCGSSVIPKPVVSGSCPRITAFTMNALTTGLSCQFVVDNFNTRFNYIIKASNFHKGTVQQMNSLPRYFVKGGALTGTTNNPVVNTPYTTRFGAQTGFNGFRIFLELKLIDTFNGVAFPSVYVSGLIH